MTSQVIFKIDKKLKDKAMKKAQSEGVALSSILKLATEAFADGKLSLGLVTAEKFNTRTAKEIDQAIKDIKAGKNLSPIFDNSADALAYLKSKR